MNLATNIEYTSARIDCGIENTIRDILYYELQLNEDLDSKLDIYELYNLEHNDMTGVVMNLEESFQIPITNVEFYSCKTIESLINLVEVNLNYYC